MKFEYPFSAVVGQDELKLALLLSAVDPTIGGVLIKGERGTAKTTIARGLAALLPPTADGASAPFVELPLGATEDRVVGSLDVTKALRDGDTQLRSGVLARANGGVLYVDEVNLLPDHLVDLLLDAAASGWVTVERDGVSAGEAARFVLVGTMNPEEGDLRPQFLDRFGLSVQVRGLDTQDLRMAAVSKRLQFDADPTAVIDAARPAEDALRQAIIEARARLALLPVTGAHLTLVTAICAEQALDGIRGDLAIVKTARALAAWEKATEIGADHVRRSAGFALPHRMRRRAPSTSFRPETPRPAPSAGRYGPDTGLPQSAADGQANRAPAAGSTAAAGSPGAGPGGNKAPGGSPGNVSMFAGGPTSASSQGVWQGVGAPFGAWTSSGGSVPGGWPASGASTGGWWGDGGAHRGAGVGGWPAAGAGGGIVAGAGGGIVAGAGVWTMAGAGAWTMAGVGGGSIAAAGGGTMAGAAGFGAGGGATPGGAVGRVGVGVGSDIGGRVGSGVGRAPIAETPAIGLVTDAIDRESSGRRGAGSVGARRAARATPYDQTGTIAVNETLTAAATRGRRVGERGLALTTTDLMQHERSGQGRSHVLFLVDASASMATQQRLELAKSAALGLLKSNYQSRDQVALMVFRGNGTDVVVPFTSDIGGVEGVLNNVPTGGRTPLARALIDAAELLRTRYPALLVVFTDGRANVSHSGGDPWHESLAACGPLRAASAGALVVDCELGPIVLGRARQLAAELGADCVPLSALQGEDLTVHILRRIEALP